MGITFEIYEGIVRIEALGDLEREGGLRSIREALATAASTTPASDKPRWGLLFDIHQYEHTRNADDLRGIAALIVLYDASLSGRCAIVGAEGLRRHVARTFGDLLEGVGQEVRFFAEIEEAEGWLRGASSADSAPGPGDDAT